MARRGEQKWRFLASRAGATTIEYAAAAAAIALIAAFAAQAAGVGVGSLFDGALAKLRDSGGLGSGAAGAGNPGAGEGGQTLKDKQP